MNRTFFCKLMCIVLLGTMMVGCNKAGKIISQFGDDAAKYGDDVYRGVSDIIEDDTPTNFDNYTPSSYESDYYGSDYNDSYNNDDYLYSAPEPQYTQCSVCGGNGYFVDMYYNVYDCEFCDNGIVVVY